MSKTGCYIVVKKGYEPFRNKVMCSSLASFDTKEEAQAALTSFRKVCTKDKLFILALNFS